MTEQTPACLFAFISAPFESPLSDAFADFNKFLKALMFLWLIFHTDRDAAHVGIMDLNTETHSNHSVPKENHHKLYNVEDEISVLWVLRSESSLLFCVWRSEVRSKSSVLVWRSCSELMRNQWRHEEEVLDEHFWGGGGRRNIIDSFPHQYIFPDGLRSLKQWFAARTPTLFTSRPDSKPTERRNRKLKKQEKTQHFLILSTETFMQTNPAVYCSDLIFLQFIEEKSERKYLPACSETQEFSTMTWLITLDLK